MKPRRTKLNREEWFERNRKALMQRYISTPTKMFWMAWLKQEYEAYRG